MAEDPNPISPTKPTPPAGVFRPAIPDHELVRPIGNGSYGEVWLARNSLGTYRAVKIVYSRTFRHVRPFDREFKGVQKFEPISRLHEGLVDILQVGRNEAGGYFYYVMELADDVACGQAIDPDQYVPRTLAHDISRLKRLPSDACRRIGIAVAAALDFLHNQGLIHRDIKPSNIVFVRDQPKLADIGLVAEKSEAKSYVGTEGFIPPEGPGTVQADIYSLGKVLYEISTGKDRHEYPDLPAELGESAERQELMALNAVVVKACRQDPAQRYGSAGALVDDLAGNSFGKPKKFRGAVPLALGLAVAALAGAAALVLYQAGTADDSDFLKDGPAGLVARWDADGTTGEAVNGLNGIPRGGVTFVPGKVGRAFHFDGWYSGIQLGNQPALHLQNLTIAAWIKRDNVSAITAGLADCGSGTVLGHGHGGYSLSVQPDGCLVLSGMTPAGIVLSSPRVTDTNWHHVAVAVDGARVTFFIDGAAYPAPEECPKPFAFDRNAAVGSTGEGFNCSLLGSLDDVRVYDRALTASEVATLFHAANTVAPDGIAHWWRAKGDARDSVGNDHGILMNGAGFAPGKTDRAFRFDGIDDYIKIPRSAALEPGSQLTIEFWMKADRDNSMGDFQGLVSSDFYGIEISKGYVEGGRLGLSFMLSSDSGRVTEFESYPDTATPNGGGAVVSAGEWHHVAGTYDGSQLQLYIDGRPWGEPTPHSGAISPMLTNSFLAIGSEDGRSVEPKTVGKRYFKGLIDEVKMYNRALSSNEIAGIFNGPAALHATGSRNPRD